MTTNEERTAEVIAKANLARRERRPHAEVGIVTQQAARDYARALAAAGMLAADDPDGAPTTDMLPADQVRPIVAAMRAAMLRDEHAYPEAKFLADLSGYIKDLEALFPAPKLPTMAEMTLDKREECRRMQADVAGYSARFVIINPRDDGGTVALITDEGEVVWEEPEDVTPRPDLPRLEWPSTEKPASGLPEGWRPAEHREYGRVIVTSTTPNCDGRVYFVFRVDGPLGHGCRACGPDELTYLDQEAVTSDAVPPNTLAMGSVWVDSEALDRACSESGRDQIVVLDRKGYAYVWSHDAEWWETAIPLSSSAPLTILYSGTEAGQ